MGRGGAEDQSQERQGWQGTGVGGREGLLDSTLGSLILCPSLCQVTAAWPESLLTSIVPTLPVKQGPLERRPPVREVPDSGFQVQQGGPPGRAIP